MNEKPIIFSGPMVRAILEGRKTQTRRVCKLQPQIVDVEPKYEKHTWGFWHDDDYPNGRVIRCPFGSRGTVLWVREAWAQPFAESKNSNGVIYRADGADYLGLAERKHGWGEAESDSWKPSIHMPRKFCRLFLTVTDVRVEKLQNISDSDVRAEGISEAAIEKCREWLHPNDCPGEAFSELWNSINEKRGYGWKENPWVWIIEFEVTKI